MAYTSKYTVELYNAAGTLLADLGGKCPTISVVKSRNRADDIQFTIDLNLFEKYCRDTNIDPKNILITDSTEVRIRRLGTYYAGGQLVRKNVQLDATTAVITCYVKGFLYLLSKRYTGDSATGTVTEQYVNITRSNLAWTLINQTQALTNGSFGITRGVAGGSSSLYAKNYKTTNIGDALQDLTELQTSPIDIEVTYNKVFNTYAMQGSERPDIVFEYPGNNIISASIDEDGSDLANEIIGRAQIATDGSQLKSIQRDTPSTTNYQLRQDVFNSQATNNLDNGLTTSTAAELGARKSLVRVPSIKVNGSVKPYITDYGIGDRVTLKVSKHALLSDINGTYRIEKTTLNVDENSNETVDLDMTNTIMAANIAEYTADTALIQKIVDMQREIDQNNTSVT